MRALLLKEYGQLEVVEMDRPAVAHDAVLVEIRACGICGSDIHGFHGESGRRQPPLVMGHEAAGVVIETGAGVTNFDIGDRVTFDSTIYCGDCFFCRRGEINLCEDRRVLGVACDDYRQHGAFAEYLSVPERICYRLPASLPFEHAAMIEAVSIAVHAVGRTSLEPRALSAATVVVFGVGMIGQLIVQRLRSLGCGKIVAVDLDSRRLELACSLGADEGLRADTCDVVVEIRAMTEGRGADAAFEVVGGSETVSSAIESVRKGGAVTLVGNLAAYVEFPLQSVVTRELSINGTCASQGEYPECIRLISEGQIQLEPLISARASLEEAADWFQRLHSGDGETMKVIVQPNG